MDKKPISGFQFLVRFLLPVVMVYGAIALFLVLRSRNEAAYAAIEAGMPKERVIGLLGEPMQRREKTDNRGEMWIYPADWYGRYFYQITFGDDADSVISKRVDDTWFQF
jgi:hypothetical protein